MSSAQPSRVKKYICFAAAGVLLLLLSACSVSRWMLVDKQAVDPRDFTVESSHFYLARTDSLSPRNPVLKLGVYTKQSLRYKQKALYERVIQQYRPKWTYTAIALISSAAIFYSTNSGKLGESLTQGERVALNMAGGLVGLTPILGMEPAGQRVRTGEQRFGAVTGNKVKQISRWASSLPDPQLELSVFHQSDTLISQRKIGVRDTVIELNLVKLVNSTRFTGLQPDSLDFHISYGRKSYHFTVAPSEFLTMRARIDEEFSTIYSKPRQGKKWAVNDLARNSTLKVTSVVDSSWFQVEFGMKPVYIPRQNVSIIWDNAVSSQQESVVTLSKIPFGEVDVESNIPVLEADNPSAIGLLIANENYMDPLSIRKYSLRDARLIDLYLTKALGYGDKQTRRLTDLENTDQIHYQLGRIGARVVPDTTELTVFISGHVVVREQKGNYQYYYIPTGRSNYRQADSDQLLDLKEFFRRLGQFPTSQTVVWADLNFHYSNLPMLQEPENLQVIRPLADIARELTESHPRSVVIFASKFSQSSHLYYHPERVDKKHRIFPYFVGRALQNRITSVPKMIQYLERNVNYTARKLHSEEQNPQSFGNFNIEFASP